jgi:hypothetical protein
MLVKRRQPDGSRALVRLAYRPDDYVIPSAKLANIRTMDGFSVRALLEMPDGPFGSVYFIDKVDRDGKTWYRLCHKTEEWCLLIEDSDNPMKDGEIRSLPPDEARAVSKGYDAGRGVPIIEETA